MVLGGDGLSCSGRTVCVVGNFFFFRGFRVFVIGVVVFVGYFVFYCF